MSLENSIKSMSFEDIRRLGAMYIDDPENQAKITRHMRNFTGFDVIVEMMQELENQNKALYNQVAALNISLDALGTLMAQYVKKHDPEVMQQFQHAMQQIQQQHQKAAAPTPAPATPQ